MCPNWELASSVPCRFKKWGTLPAPTNASLPVRALQLPGAARVHLWFSPECKGENTNALLFFAIRECLEIAPGNSTWK